MNIKKVRIGEIGTWSGGGTPSKGNPLFWTKGTIPWVSPKDMKTSHISKTQDYITPSAVENSSVKLIPQGSILIVTRSGILQHSLPVALTSTEVTINQDLKAITPNNDVLPEYLLVYLQAAAGEILRTCTKSGTTVASINTEELQDFTVPLPPLKIQRQIAAKLDLLSSHNERAHSYLSAIPTLSERFRQSVLARAFTGELTADWRKANPDVEPASELLERIKVERREKWIHNYAKNLADRARNRAEKQGKPFGDDKWQAYYESKLKAGAKKYTEPQAVDPEKEGLPEIPESWEWVRVEMLGAVQLGRQRSPKYHSGSNMVPYLRVANVFENRIDISDVMEMHFSSTDYEQYKLESGDILLNEGQSAELVGRPAIFRDELPDVCFTNTLIRYRTYTGLSPEFALLIFRGYMHTGRFTEIAKVTTNIAHLGAGRFANMGFPLPPLAEQQEIVRRTSDLLDMLTTFEAQTGEARALLDRLKSSTLSAMLGA